jgi:hypothetical protein
MMSNARANDSDFKWVNAADGTVTVSGLAWFNENAPSFSRLPACAKDIIPPIVWQLAQNPSGAAVSFKTDSSSLRIRVNHGAPDMSALSMHHMSMLACAGIDLYQGTAPNMDFWAASIPTKALEPYVHTYFENLDKKQRHFTLYLPVYATLTSLEIGIDPDASIQSADTFKNKKPIVFYGTSITQSGCASRGSNGFVPIIGRRLNTQVVNLGFSGSGCGEPELAQLITEIDAACYVVDSVANMNIDIMNQRYEKFITILRTAKPNIPIVLMTRVHFAHESFKGSDYANSLNEVVMKTYKKFVSKGDKNIHLFDTAAIIKPGRDHPSVDGIHLNDQGFKLIADNLAPTLQKIIQPN